MNSHLSSYSLLVSSHPFCTFNFVSDLVQQVLKQFPNWFEFNEFYLIAILDEVTSTYDTAYLVVIPWSLWHLFV
jgi:hypothetical protein